MLNLKNELNEMINSYKKAFELHNSDIADKTHIIKEHLNSSFKKSTIIFSNENNFANVESNIEDDLLKLDSFFDFLKDNYSASIDLSLHKIDFKSK